jgi:hypothetical protein
VVRTTFYVLQQTLMKRSNARDDSSRLKWEGIKYLLEDAQSDILLLLDCCAMQDAPTAGSNGVKQAIAAYGRDSIPQEIGGKIFTFSLIEALHKLSNGPPFNVQRLHEEIIAAKHQRGLEHSSLTNGNGQPSMAYERMPIAFNLTPGNLQTITLSPLTAAQNASPSGSPDGDSNGQRPIHGDQGSSSSPPDLVFEEPRALLSLAFQGEPSHEMASFKSWLNSTPATGAKVTVEGMFQGPPMVMIISMPITVWTAIQGDGLCVFLGYVKSHNMLREYQKLVDVTTINNTASTKHIEDGKILLDVREMANASPTVPRHDPQLQSGQNLVYQLPAFNPTQPSLSQAPQPVANMIDHGITPDRKEEVEDSDEMHEAAIQLKALSHPRPLNTDDHPQDQRSASHQPHEGSPGFRSMRGESRSSQEEGESAGDDQMYSSEYNSPASRPKARRSIQKQGPKQDTRCTMCSHAPFKDSSSLRKHVAAAHTRPFPCAFSFAGCTSTFGSKNEWKRHIASQHLCLTYYRCSSCPQSTIEGKGNEFNRKDLFTQHLRRMHAPFAIKKAIAKGDSKLQLEWETHVKEMQASCLVIRRSPPQRSACPKADCSNVFEGAGSWDDWTEHVGRHMEKGEASRLGVDRLLARWAHEEGIIERKEDGEYRLCGTEREGGNPGGYYSDGASRMQVDDSRLDEHNMLVDEALR